MEEYPQHNTTSLEQAARLELHEWNPDEHADLPSPETVFHAPVISKQGGAIVAKVTGALAVKFGTRVFLAEAETMRFVSSRTSVPIPKLHGIYTHDSQVFIFMDFIPGQQLDNVWPQMTSEAKKTLASDLKVRLDSLRSLHGTYVGGINYTPCSDLMLSGAIPQDRGPFSTVAAFHDTLIKVLNWHPGTFPSTKALRSILNDNSPIVFSHSDLCPRNILVSEEGKLLAIIDWEAAGFYPDYWEWMKACIVIPDDWYEALEQVLSPHERESLIEDMFLRKLLL